MLALLKTAAVKLLVSNNNVIAVEGDDYFSWDGQSTLVRLLVFIRCRLLY